MIESDLCILFGKLMEATGSIPRRSLTGLCLSAKHTISFTCLGELKYVELHYSQSQQIRHQCDVL